MNSGKFEILQQHLQRPILLVSGLVLLRGSLKVIRIILWVTTLGKVSNYHYSDGHVVQSKSHFAEKLLICSIGPPGNCSVISPLKWVELSLIKWYPPKECLWLIPLNFHNKPFWQGHLISFKRSHFLIKTE